MSIECHLAGEQSLPVSGSVRLFQITDTHLMAAPGGRLLNVDTDASLAAVIALAGRAEQADALLITGDIAGDGSGAAYERLDAALAPLNAPSFWLPGNHDEREDNGAVLSERFQRQVRFPHWDVLMLNSQLPGAVEGSLTAVELAALSAAVAEANASGKHLLIAVHHPFWPLGSAWLDSQRIAETEGFMAALAPLHNAGLIISGHVHQASDEIHEGRRFLTTPSTCIQFARGSQDFKIDDVAPGYRWLVLHPDGQIDTGVERVTDVVFPVDLQSEGYL
jgi:3',5'-cyclic-AMP phosphodiesterase